MKLGNALADKNQLDDAIAEFKKAIALEPNIATAHNDLGIALKNNNQLEEAIAEFKKAIALDLKFAPAHANLGSVLATQGKLDDAILEFDKAIALGLRSPKLHGGLALALLYKGRFVEAKTNTQKGLELAVEKDPLRPQLLRLRASCDALLAWEAKLPEVLAGKEHPKDNGERLAYIQLCQYQQRHAAAAKLYADGFAADARLADDLQAVHRYNAACSAALAAAGQGKDADKLTDLERANLRKQALQWLRADLAAWAKQLDKDADKARPVVQGKMTHWKQDTDLIGVRDPKALEKLPPDERDAWQKLWQDVDALLAKTQEKK